VVRTPLPFPVPASGENGLNGDNPGPLKPSSRSRRKTLVPCRFARRCRSTASGRADRCGYLADDALEKAAEFRRYCAPQHGFGSHWAGAKILRL